MAPQYLVISEQEKVSLVDGRNLEVIASGEIRISDKEAMLIRKGLKAQERYKPYQK